MLLVLLVCTYEYTSIMVCCTNSACIHWTLCKKNQNGNEYMFKIGIVDCVKKRDKKRKEIHSTKRKSPRKYTQQHQHTHTANEWVREILFYFRFFTQSDAEHCETQSIKMSASKGTGRYRWAYIHACTDEENALRHIINVCGSQFHCMYHQRSTERRIVCAMPDPWIDHSRQSSGILQSVNSTKVLVRSVFVCSFFFFFFLSLSLSHRLLSLLSSCSITLSSSSFFPFFFELV